MNKIIVENDTMRFYSNPVPIPIGGSQWSKIFFMFSDEWEDLRKIAQFRQGELKRNVDIDSNNFCYVPNEMLPDMCGELSIVGYPQDTASAIIATANSLMLSFVQGFESGGEPAVPPTPDLYQKLMKEFAESGGGNPNAVLYSKQELTEAQQAQARKNITVAKSYQIPVMVDGDNISIDNDYTKSNIYNVFLDVQNGVLPYFVANGEVFICCGAYSAGSNTSISFVCNTSLSATTQLVSKRYVWTYDMGNHLYESVIDMSDYNSLPRVAKFRVGAYNYIYGPSYEDIIADVNKYPVATIDGRLDNAVLSLFKVDDVDKSIIYLRTDVLETGELQMRGLIIKDGQPPQIVDEITPPLYVKPASGIPKSDLADAVQTIKNILGLDENG